ncbi:MAG: polyphosphate polymerase domain-containing protein [Spirochaetaceae bacterium]
MNGVSRFERKYFLNLDEYYPLRNRLVPFAERDYYTRLAGDAYLVRSIYYDTRDYRAWYEKEDGDFGRIKLRIRSYTDRWAECRKVSVEIKTKQANAMVKYSTHVEAREYEEFVKTGRWPSHRDETVNEFERLRRVRRLVPVCLVQYRREGFRARDGSAVRLTIDHKVESTRASWLFPDSPILKEHRPRRTILEVKTQEKEPDWLLGMIKEHRLKAWANSKYWQGIEIIRPNMVTPRLAAP